MIQSFHSIPQGSIKASILMPREELRRSSIPSYIKYLWAHLSRHVEDGGQRDQGERSQPHIQHVPSLPASPGIATPEPGNVVTKTATPTATPRTKLLTSMLTLMCCVLWTGGCRGRACHYTITNNTVTLPGQVLGLLPCLPSSLDTCILNQKYFTTVKLLFNNSQFKELNFFALL